jgi:hypothetical protein
VEGVVVALLAGGCVAGSTCAVVDCSWAPGWPWPCVMRAGAEGLVALGPVVAGPVVEAPGVAGPVVEGPGVAGPAVEGPAVEGPAVAGPLVAGPLAPGPVVAYTRPAPRTARVATDVVMNREAGMVGVFRGMRGDMEGLSAGLAGWVAG